MYWKKRTQIFGERAFLSLRDCSGSGALDKAAVKILQKGAAVQLPDDAKGPALHPFKLVRCDDQRDLTGASLPSLRLKANWAFEHLANVILRLSPTTRLNCFWHFNLSVGRLGPVAKIESARL
jgi:hypothetical protein